MCAIKTLDRVGYFRNVFRIFFKQQVSVQTINVRKRQVGAETKIILVQLVIDARCEDHYENEETILGCSQTIY